MQITLLRHGKPKMPTQKLIQPNKFNAWIESYDNAKLCVNSAPADGALALAANAKMVICSHLSRSIASAQRLGIQPTISDSLFREMEMPYWSLPAPALSPNTWAVLFRLCWFAGLTSNAESFTAAKARAMCAANQLIKVAQEHNQILFVGHGLLNRFIAKTLLANGWLGPKNPGKKYWEYGVYTYERT
jgi:broad specificity phosphatase PhoE